MAKTLLWSAGVLGATIKGIDGALIVKGNRFKVDAFNRVIGSKNVFAIGDVASIVTDENPYGHPMVAPVAIQQGEQLANNIVRLTSGKEMKHFIYHDRGSMATVGRHKAVVDFTCIKFQGFFAWFIWLFVHLLYLVGFRNKLVVFLSWVWNYISYDRAIRLIIRPFKK